MHRYGRPRPTCEDRCEQVFLDEGCGLEARQEGDPEPGDRHVPHRHVGVGEIARPARQRTGLGAARDLGGRAGEADEPVGAEIGGMVGSAVPVEV